MKLESRISNDVLAGVTIIVSIILAGTFFPFLSLPFRLLTPLPILFYRSKLGKQKTFTMFLMTSITVGTIFGGITVDLMVIIGLMCVGFFLGESFEKKHTIEKTVLIPSGIVLIFCSVSLYLYSVHSNLSVLSLIHQYIGSNLDTFLIACREANIENNLTKLVEEKKEHIVSFAAFVLPSSAVVTTCFISWINILVARPLMQKSGIVYPDFGNLNHWNVPDNSIWLLILSGLILLINNKFIGFLGINILLIIMAVYFFQGIAIISFYLTKKRVTTLAKVVVYSLIGINHFFFIIVVGVGIFDIWINFRKITRR